MSAKRLVFVREFRTVVGVLDLDIPPNVCTLHLGIEFGFMASSANHIESLELHHFM